jgi:hypothetical protein
MIRIKPIVCRNLNNSPSLGFKEEVNFLINFEDIEERDMLSFYT